MKTSLGNDFPTSNRILNAAVVAVRRARFRQETAESVPYRERLYHGEMLESAAYGA
jgi:hypothetical protein